MVRAASRSHKGCEWPVVVVSNAAADYLRGQLDDVEDELRVAQAMLIALTRSTRLLIIAMDSTLARSGPTLVSRELAKLEAASLNFRTERAEAAFMQMQALSAASLTVRLPVEGAVH